MPETSETSVENYQVFISYARPDAEFATSLYDWLKGAGFEVWMDIKNLKPGQNWDFEINIALEQSSFILILLSHRSVDRRGYVQRELKVALDKYKDKLIDDIFIIPILIEDDVTVPRQLQSIQYISSSKPGYENVIADAINTQIERLGGERRKIQEEKDVYWSFTKKREVWDGLPGYEYEANLIELTSQNYSNLNEISQVVRGRFLDDLFKLRENKLNQSTEQHSFADDRWSRTDTFHASCGDPIVKNRVLSIEYLVNWYSAGAAHPNHLFSTFCFVLYPLFRIRELSQIFIDPDKALELLKVFAINILLSKITEEGEPILEEEFVRSGITDWESFPAFSFKEDGVGLLFPPYHVGPYAAGSFEVMVPYRTIFNLIAREYKIALGIQYLRN